MKNFDELNAVVKSTLLTEGEYESLIQYSSRNPAVKKLLKLYDQIVKSILKDPIMAKMAHIQYMKDSILEAIEHMSSDEVVDIVHRPKEYKEDGLEDDEDLELEDDDQDGDFEKATSIRIRMLSNKRNALPERVRDMDKALGSAFEDLIKLLAVSAEVGSSKDSGVMEDNFGSLSFSDMQAKKKGRKK